MSVVELYAKGGRWQGFGDNAGYLNKALRALGGAIGDAGGRRWTSTRALHALDVHFSSQLTGQPARSITRSFVRAQHEILWKHR